jgi:hypothetical protein
MQPTHQNALSSPNAIDESAAQCLMSHPEYNGADFTAFAAR